MIKDGHRNFCGRFLDLNFRDLKYDFYITAFPVFLRLVHGFVGGPVIIEIRRGILFIDCGADAYADRDTAFTQLSGTQKDFPTDAFHQPFVTGMIGEQSEFITANAENGISPPAYIPQDGCETAQDFISLAVAVGIINAFKVVNIKNEHGVVRTGTLLHQPALYELSAGGGIVYACVAVHICQMLQLQPVLHLAVNILKKADCLHITGIVHIRSKNHAVPPVIAAGSKSGEKLRRQRAFLGIQRMKDMGK